MRYKYIKKVLAPVGADGSAAASAVVAKGNKGSIVALSIDYQNQPVTTDVTITDGAGHTVFSRADSATDVAWSPTGDTGIDEGGAASAGVDQPGLHFSGGLTIAVAQGDGQTSGDEKVVVELLLLVAGPERGSADIKYHRIKLRPVGADGSAAVSDAFAELESGQIIALGIDYQNQPVTTDVTIVDGAAHTVFSRANSATDVAFSPTARPGVDEGGAATASTDMPGLPFAKGLTVSVAQGDGQTTGDELIILEAMVRSNK